MVAPTATATIDFDNPAPSGSPDDLFNGIFEGIDFGTNQWRWSGPFSPNTTNSIYFDSDTGTSRSFQFVTDTRVLQSIEVFVLAAGTVTVSDNQGQTISQALTENSIGTITTGWTQPATTISVEFDGGAWNIGVDNITHRP